MDPLVQQDQLGQQVTKVLRVLLEKQGAQAYQVIEVTEVLLVVLELLDPLVQQDQLVLLEKEVIKENVDLLEDLDQVVKEV